MSMETLGKYSPFRKSAQADDNKVTLLFKGGCDAGNIPEAAKTSYSLEGVVSAEPHTGSENTKTMKW